MPGWWQRLWRRAPQPVESSEASGGEWRVLERARLQESRDGQVLEYPGRTAECPRGHRRVIPTRFDQPLVELRCDVCGRRYPLRQP